MQKTLCFLLILALMLSLSTAAFADLSPGENAGAQLKMIASYFSMLRQPDGVDPWYYAVTDLDHNGRLELLACSADAVTGHAHMRGWEVSADGKRLDAIHTENEEVMLDVFINIITDSADTYFDAARNAWFYIITYHSFDNLPEYNLSQVSDQIFGMSMVNGTIYDGLLASRINTKVDGQTSVTITGSHQNEITEDQFWNIASTTFAGYPRSSTSFDWFLASEANNLSRFADSYAVFSGDRTGVQDTRNLTAVNTANASVPIVTKNPTDENRGTGETAWFVANATGYTSLYWTFVSPQGQTYSVQDIRNMVGGTNISGENTTTLTIGNLSTAMNGWGAFCTFSNGSQIARTTTAYMNVYVPSANVKNTNSNNYYNWYGLSDEDLFGLALVGLALSDNDWALVGDTSYYTPWDTSWNNYEWNNYLDTIWAAETYGGSYGGYDDYSWMKDLSDEDLAALAMLAW